MKKAFFLAALLVSFFADAQIKYPETRKDRVVDNYNGTTVEDPYRWLEDDNSEETKTWVQQQNQVTFNYLETIPLHSQVKKRLEELWNYPKYSSPFKKGEFYYFFKNDGLQNQSVMYRQKGLEGKIEEFLNPNTLNKEGIAALGSINFNKNGKYLAYSVALAGSDWQEIFIMNTATKTALHDKIQWVKFGGVSWNGEDGFYYSRYDKPKDEAILSGQNQFHKVYYHKLGTKQAEDRLIYEDKKNPLRYHGAWLTEDGRFLLLRISQGTSGAEIRYRDMKDPAQKTFKVLIAGFATEPDVIDNNEGKILVRTNDDAPNYKVVLIDPNNPGKKNWKTIIAEKQEALQDVSTGGGYLFASYLKDASTKVYQHQYDGSLIREIKLPGIGSAYGFGGNKEDKEFFYTYSSFNAPPAIYRFTIGSGQSNMFRKTEVKVDAGKFVTEQIFASSKDGTAVPVFITYKKGMRMNGNNPVLLYGYGGFNIPITPYFSISNAYFIEQGGIYAVANLRGGSEYGEQWHRAGMLDKKQNVFDDFIAAAEFLIARGYTNPSKLAIRGESNGGLLVGAAMTQRPDLFKVALPLVGVMDMLRYHKFTVGWGWAVEYGNADSAMQFPYLYRYSPYHNLKPGVSYPATLITTGDHDDRVVPAHSFKYAARLQEYNKGNNPVLIRIETNAGHGGGKPTSKQIEEAADIWTFVMHNLGMTAGSDYAKDGAKDEGKDEGKVADGNNIGKDETRSEATETKPKVESRLDKAFETRNAGLKTTNEKTGQKTEDKSVQKTTDKTTTDKGTQPSGQKPQKVVQKQKENGN